MEDYLNTLVKELPKDSKFKDIKGDIKKYEHTDLKALLLDLGYENEEVKKFIEEENAFFEEYGDMPVTDEMIDKYTKEIENDVVKSAITKNKEVVFLLGLPGAGKSSSLKMISGLYDNRKFYLIDADDFKQGKKDSVNYSLSPLANPNNNGIDIRSVHEASSSLAKFATSLLSNNEYNIALPKVGDNYNKLLKQINELKAKGYKIYIHFLYTTVQTALERNLKRFLSATKEGRERRMVSATYIFDTGYKPLYNFLLLVKDDICDDYALWDGERCEVGKPNLLLKKSK